MQVLRLHVFRALKSQNDRGGLSSFTGDHWVRTFVPVHQLSNGRYSVTTDFYHLENIHEAGFLWCWHTNVGKGSGINHSAHTPEIGLGENLDDGDVESVDVM